MGNGDVSNQDAEAGETKSRVRSLCAVNMPLCFIVFSIVFLAQAKAHRHKHPGNWCPGWSQSESLLQASLICLAFQEPLKEKRRAKKARDIVQIIT